MTGLVLGPLVHGVDSMRAYALAMAGLTDTREQMQWPDMIVFLGDQVYACVVQDAPRTGAATSGLDVDADLAGATVGGAAAVGTPVRIAHDPIRTFENQPVDRPDRGPPDRAPHAAGLDHSGTGGQDRSSGEMPRDAPKALLATS